MKKIICLIDDTFRLVNCKKGDIFDLIGEGDEYWDILIDNKVHRIAKFFNEFMTLSKYRKLKLQKIETYDEN